MEQFNRLARKDSDGNLLNDLKLNGIESQDIKVLAAKLQEISNKARTNGEYQQIGEIYGFQVVVKSEASQKDMFDFVDNRFMVKGMGNIYYTHNNGHLANDPKLACMNFLSALEKIPKVIENHERELEKVKRDVETYKAIASGEWKKEGELRKLKSELSELDRKISLTINKNKEDGAKEQGVKANTVESKSTNQQKLYYKF